MIEFLLWMALKNTPKEILPLEYEVPVTKKVYVCPEGYQLVRWHEHMNMAITYSNMAVYREDRPSGYYPVEPEVETTEQHPDKCVLKNGTGEHDGKKLPSK